MGYADRVPNRDVMSEHQRVPRVVPILGSTDDHLAAAVLARFGCARSRRRAGSGLRRPAVGLAARHVNFVGHKRYRVIEFTNRFNDHGKIIVRGST